MRLSKDTKEHEMQSRLTAMYTKIAESHADFNGAMNEYARLLYEREHQSRVDVQSRKRAVEEQSSWDNHFELAKKNAQEKRAKRPDPLAEMKKNMQEYHDKWRAEENDKKKIAAGALIIIN